MAWRLLPDVFQQTVDVNGDPAVGYTIEAYIYNTTTPTPLATDGAGAGQATSFTLNSRGAPQSAGGTEVSLYGDTTLASGLKIVLKDADGGVVRTYAGPVHPVALSVGDLADVDADNIAVTPAGGTETNLGTWVNRRYKTPEDFGVVGDGVTNDTTNMKAFFDYCIANRVRGVIRGGDYLITPGVLAFDCAFTDTPWPVIETDGHEAVRFLKASAADASMLALTNGTASSGSFAGWRGGKIGGITFDQNGFGQASAQHGLLLRGVWGLECGWMQSDDLGGCGVAIPRVLYTGNNPDPYNVAFVEFDGIESNRCAGFAFYNGNGIGFTGCTVKNFRAIENELGGWFGFGGANRINIASLGSNNGWAFDDGCQDENLGIIGRFEIGMAEIDNSENGIRLNRSSYLKLKNMRMVHRYNFNQNASNLYWPRTAIEIGAGALTTSMQNVEIEVVHRIEAGSTKGNVGLFYNGTSDAGIAGLRIDQRTLDNASHGYVDTDLYTNVSASTSTLLTRDGDQVIYDTMLKDIVSVRSATSETIPNSAAAAIAATSKVNFATEIYDRIGLYDSTTSEFTVPRTGPYTLKGCIATSAAAGTRVRVGFAVDGTTVIAARNGWAATTNPQHYTIEQDVSLTAGQKLTLIADNNSGGAINLVAPNGVNADLRWSVQAI